jgi:hypothetical protein
MNVVQRLFDRGVHVQERPSQFPEIFFLAGIAAYPKAV